MRKIAFIMTLFLSSSILYAQRYKDVFPEIAAADEDKAFELLSEFLKVDPDHPNANLRLANIYIKRYKEVDVLREYDKALALAEQAKQHLVKTKVTIDEREIKKNQEYYIGVLPDAQSSFEAIDAYFGQEYGAIEDFKLKLPAIYTEFTRSVEKYDEVVKEFSDIVGSHNSLKELYLLYNIELGQRLANLKSNYDSTKYYFDNYLDLRKNYKINAVQQSYTEKAIKVYRLDGLVTQINFLQPNIELWDYSSWVDSVNTVVANDINDLRVSLTKNDKKLKDALIEVKKIDNPDSFKVISADKALIFNLMKYDYKNTLVPYLGYQEFKQTLFKEAQRKTYFDTASITIDRKLAYYNDMLYAAKKADSIILDFDNKYNVQQLARHQDFINETFGNAENLKKYMDGEKEINKAIFMEQVGNIKEAIIAAQRKNYDSIEVKSRRTVIPTYIVDQLVQEMALNHVQTKYIVSSADESKYVAGHVITDSKLKNTEIIIAKLSKDNKVVWLKNFDFELNNAGADANHFLGDIKVTAEGVIALVRSLAIDDSKAANTLLHLTADGNIKFTSTMNTELFPREVIYDERSNLFITSFFGDKDIVDLKSNSELSIRGVNGLGEEVWHFDYSYNGNYVKMLTSQSQILIGGNYSLIKNESGRTFSKPTGTNSFIISLNYNGALKKVMCYSSDTSYETTTFFKVADRNLNLLGSTGEHLIVDGALENIYSSVKLK